MTTLDVQLRDRYSTRVHKLIKRCIVYAGTPGFENACIYVCSNHLVVNQFALPPVIKGLLVLVQAVLPHLTPSRWLTFAHFHFFFSSSFSSSSTTITSISISFSTNFTSSRMVSIFYHTKYFIVNLFKKKKSNQKKERDFDRSVIQLQSVQATRFALKKWLLVITSDHIMCLITYRSREEFFISLWDTTNLLIRTVSLVLETFTFDQVREGLRKREAWQNEVRLWRDEARCSGARQGEPTRCVSVCVQWKLFPASVANVTAQTRFTS